MMKQSMHAQNTSKKVSRKVQGLFDKSLIIKSVSQPLKRKQSIQKKLKEFVLKAASQPGKANESNPAKLDLIRDLDAIGMVPVIELTEEQAQNLVTTTALLHEQFSKYGMLKLRLPKGMEVLDLDLGSAKRKLTIRQQVLPFLPQGRSFVNIKEAYTLEEMREYAAEIERDFTFATGEVFESEQKYLRDEREYWGIVHGAIEKEVQEDEDGFTVEYASDLAIDQYLDFDDSVGKQKKDEDTTFKFALRKVYDMDDSLFQIVKNKSESISGIVIPWAYVATKYSSFCWHTEDLFLYSFNYMHEGGCKVWYSIPFEDVEKVRNLLLREYASDLKKRPALLDEVLISFSPVKFLREGIRVYKTYQEPGDLIVTFPGVYHGGFSPTFNICEAVNMAGVDWIDSARKHMEMNAREGFPRKSCFCLEWMIYESMRSAEVLNFSEDAKEVLTKQYRVMVTEEVALRKALRQDVHEEEIFDGKKLKFFDVQCSTCRYYTYLSCVGCRGCQKITCLKCSRECPCKAPQHVLFVRSTDTELLNY